MKALADGGSVPERLNVHERKDPNSKKDQPTSDFARKRALFESLAQSGSAQNGVARANEALKRSAQPRVEQPAQSMENPYANYPSGKVLAQESKAKASGPPRDQPSTPAQRKESPYANYRFDEALAQEPKAKASGPRQEPSKLAQGKEDKTWDYPESGSYVVERPTVKGPNDKIAYKLPTDGHVATGQFVAKPTGRGYVQRAENGDLVHYTNTQFETSVYAQKTIEESMMYGNNLRVTAVNNELSVQRIETAEEALKRKMKGRNH